MYNYNTLVESAPLRTHKETLEVWTRTDQNRVTVFYIYNTGAQLCLFKSLAQFNAFQNEDLHEKYELSKEEYDRLEGYHDRLDITQIKLEIYEY